MSEGEVKACGKMWQPSVGGEEEDEEGKRRERRKRERGKREREREGRERGEKLAFSVFFLSVLQPEKRSTAQTVGDFQT